MARAPHRPSVDCASARLAAFPLVAVLAPAALAVAAVCLLPRAGSQPADGPPAPDDSWMNCYAVVAGKDCTVDGSVIYAHNEDSGHHRAVHFWKVPAREHGPDESQRLFRGGSEPYAAKTHGYVWCQMPGLQYSDSYLNEHGVAVGSNGCQSKEGEPELTDGGITFMLRRIVAARATSARHGVQIAGSLLKKFGYADTGRTLTIADGDEAWLMNIVRGKHWAAARVPDDKCAVVANHYTIHHVDPADKANFDLSPGLIEHARNRGWYDPDRDGAFDFATVYGTAGARKHHSNIRRAWRGNNLVGKGEQEEHWLQPTFVTPNKKLSAADLMGVLRDHYNGTRYDLSKGYTECSPYKMGQPTICSGTTTFSTVFHLRGGMPAGIGAVMWIAMCRPDSSTFVPWYAGIQQIPPGFSRGTADNALARHFDKEFVKLGQPPAFAAFQELQDTLEKSYTASFPRLDALRDKLEARIHRLQAEVEASALRLHAQDPAAAWDYLTAYSLGQQARADALRDRLITELRPAAAGGASTSGASPGGSPGGRD